MLQLTLFCMDSIRYTLHLLCHFLRLSGYTPWMQLVVACLHTLVESRNVD